MSVYKIHLRLCDFHIFDVSHLIIREGRSRVIRDFTKHTLFSTNTVIENTALNNPNCYNQGKNDLYSVTGHFDD
jgi:hypothetical protein